MKTWSASALFAILALTGCNGAAASGNGFRSLVPDWAGNRNDDEIDQLAVAEVQEDSPDVTPTSVEEPLASWDEIESDLTESKASLNANDKAEPRAIDPDIDEWLAARRAEVIAPELP